MAKPDKILFWFVMFIFVAIVAATFDPAVLITNETPIEVKTETSQIKIELNTTSLPWGNVKIGKTYHQAITITNKGTIGANIFLNIKDFEPLKAQQYLNVYWDRQNYRLDVNKQVVATFTLEVSANTKEIKDFGFQVIINAISK